MPLRRTELAASSVLGRRDTTYGLFGNVTESEAEDAKYVLDEILVSGYQNIVVSMLFTLLTLAFFMTVRYLLADGMRRRSNKWMLAALTLMYGCAVVSYSFNLLGFRLRVKAATSNFTGRYIEHTSNLEAATDIGQYILQGLSILCGDLVILWRTAVVWHNSAVMRRLNYAFFILIILTWIAGVAILATFGLQFLLIPLALSLTVNIWSTAAIGYKTWHRRRMLRQQIFMAGRSSVSAVEGALAVLTETGIVYTALWVIYVSIIAAYFFSPTAYEEIALDRGFQWTWMIMSMLIPLYPTSLILLIARHKTPLSETLTSIDVSTAVATSSTASSTAEDVELQAVPDPDDKIGDAYYDPYAGAAPAVPDARTSLRLEPNRRR
ncbi:unnamed protein product [Peniophora sp. CBMAI 1063]|nr:unnamed protein product [Peniophora sp. CBMAI 1063]